MAHPLLHFDFGNDDSTWCTWGNAVLNVWLNTVWQGQVVVRANLDNVMNQTIAYYGAWDYATYEFQGDHSGGLIEVIDNVVVPEPATLALLGLAVLLIRRR